jgi:hypothetical protein
MLRLVAAPDASANLLAHHDMSKYQAMKIIFNQIKSLKNN